MVEWKKFAGFDSGMLEMARSNAKVGADFVSHIARRLTAPKPNYEHYALKWEADSGRFVTEELKPGLALKLQMSQLGLEVVENGETATKIGAGKVPFSEELALLEAAFGSADFALKHVVSKLRKHKPGPVICWPHHFDIATLITFDEKRGDEQVSIGVGMSPGDQYYSTPYFYVTPWPYPAADKLADPPAPYKWHTHEFTGLIYDIAHTGCDGDLGATLLAGVRLAAQALDLKLETNS